MRQTYKLNLNFMALMLSVYGTPVDGSEERDYHDDPDECIHFLLNGTWKLSDKGDTGFVRHPEKQLSFFDLF